MHACMHACACMHVCMYKRGHAVLEHLCTREATTIRAECAKPVPSQCQCQAMPCQVRACQAGAKPVPSHAMPSPCLPSQCACQASARAKPVPSPCHAKSVFPPRCSCEHRLGPGAAAGVLARWCCGVRLLMEPGVPLSWQSALNRLNSLKSSVRVMLVSCSSWRIMVRSRRGRQTSERCTGFLTRRGGLLLLLLLLLLAPWCGCHGSGFGKRRSPPSPLVAGSPPPTAVACARPKGPSLRSHSLLSLGSMPPRLRSEHRPRFCRALKASSRRT